eukprot:2906202-Amphidinium_carterae.1
MQSSRLWQSHSDTSISVASLLGLDSGLCAATTMEGLGPRCCAALLPTPSNKVFNVNHRMNTRHCLAVVDPES